MPKGLWDPRGAPSHQGLPFGPCPSPSRPPEPLCGFSPVLSARDLRGPQGLLASVARGLSTGLPRLGWAPRGAAPSLPRPSVRPLVWSVWSLAVSRQLCVTVRGTGPQRCTGRTAPACDHGCSGVCRSVPHLRRALQPRGSCAELSPPWPVGWGECPFSVPPRMGVPVAFCGASLSSACLALQNPPASGRQTAPPATARGGLELSPDFIFMQRHGNRVQSKTRAQGSLPKARPC